MKTILNIYSPDNVQTRYVISHMVHNRRLLMSDVFLRVGKTLQNKPQNDYLDRFKIRLIRFKLKWPAMASS